jgi:hypothetical protein
MKLQRIQPFSPARSLIVAVDYGNNLLVRPFLKQELQQCAVFMCVRWNERFTPTIRPGRTSCLAVITAHTTRQYHSSALL